MDGRENVSKPLDMLINMLKGFIIGCIVLIPGMSAGTVIILVGLYGTLIAHLNGFYKSKKNFIDAVIFVLPIAIGGAIGIYYGSKAILFMITEFSLPMFALFAGAVTGIIPFIFKGAYSCHSERSEESLQLANTSKSFRWWHPIPVIIAGAVVITFALLRPESTAVQELTLSTALLLAVAGAIAAADMLIPGISGSFVLLLMGLYDTMLTALNTFNIPILLVFMAGVPVGLLVASKGVGYFLKNHRTGAYLAIMGFLIGSVIAMFIIPETYASYDYAIPSLVIVSAIILFIVGFVSVYVMTKFKKDKELL